MTEPAGCDRGVNPGPPWDGNWRAKTARIPVHGCPSDGLKDNEFVTGNLGWARIRTNYMPNYGNTNWGQTAIGADAFLGAPFGNAVKINIRDIIDGTSNTALFLEVIAPNGPGYDGNIADPVGRNGSAMGRFPPNSPSFEISEVCPAAQYLNGIPGCTTNGAIDQQIFTSRSKHTGGVHASMCDGSVRFVSSNVDTIVWRGVCSTRGSELVGSNF